MRYCRTMPVLLLVSVALIGCTTGTSIVTGTVRPPISPSEVRLYLEPPSIYETIGIVEASSEVGFSSQAAQDRAIVELKSRAAEMGANGILLMDVGEGRGDPVVFYSEGLFFVGAVHKKVASGRAIFVIEK